MNNKKTNDKIIEILKEDYGETTCGLDFENPYELLVATILSAQCTDVRVNKITPDLFKKYPTVQDLALANTGELQDAIHSCGFYQNKSKSLLGASQKIVTDFNGEVPNNMDDLISLPGVGRKTANVVLSNAYGVQAIAVDTHVFRVANRLGMADAKNVLETEMQLQKNIPQQMWSNAHHWLIWHGRKVCTARSPKCELCDLSGLCKYYKEQNK